MNLVTLLPKRPAMDNEQLSKWLFDHGRRGREVLTYRKVKIRDPLTEELEPWAECTCSVCGAKWHTKIFSNSTHYPYFEDSKGLVLNGMKTTCTECGAKLEAAYYTRLKRNPIVSKTYPWEIVKVGTGIAFICWAVEYEIDEYGPHIYTEPRNAYVVDDAKKWHRFTAMERSGWSSMSAMIYTGKWYKTPKFSVPDGNFLNMLPHDPNVYEGTILENAKLEKLEALEAGADLVLYARTYIKHPSAENITMNTPELMAAAMWWAVGPAGLDWIDWKKKKPHEMLYMEKPEYKAAVGCTVEKSKEIIKHQKAVAACLKWGATEEYAADLGEDGTKYALGKKKRLILERWGLVATWNYICRTADGKTGAGVQTKLKAIDLCEDYWADLQRVGQNLEDRAVAFPGNITTAHARIVAAIKYQEDETLREKFARLAEQLEPLTWEADGFTIRPAKNESQLVAEGKALGHCVGGYGAEHCRGNSIFFIRRAEDMEIPLYTLQLDTKTGRILQNRGQKNREPEPEAKAFAERWRLQIVMPWVEHSKKKEKAPVKETA